MSSYYTFAKKYDWHDKFEKKKEKKEKEKKMQNKNKRKPQSRILHIKIMCSSYIDW